MKSPFIVLGPELDTRYTVLETGFGSARVLVETGKVTPRGFRKLRQKTLSYRTEQLDALYARRAAR